MGFSLESVHMCLRETQAPTRMGLFPFQLQNGRELRKPAFGAGVCYYQYAAAS